MILGAVDIVVAGAVDDRLRRDSTEDRPHRHIVGDVEILVRQRDHVVSVRALVNNGGTKLTARADHRDAHQAARPAANARIRASSNTPSHRATTTVAMQLPMTFTDVRPMSMI